MEIINTIGRRKTSIARVYVKPGKGTIIVNDRELATYFTSEILQITVKQAMTLVKVEGSYDVTVNVEGGGNKGQAEAIRLAIARGLVKVDEANKSPLRKGGLMTRDPRMVERKKPEQKKARKRFQFSKR